MQTPNHQYTERFGFLSEALNGCGGFTPSVLHTIDSSGLSKPYSVTSKCYLTPYPRESGLKFAARAAVAVYENHLRSACERFVGYISKRAPLRDGLNNPLIAAMVQDCDWSNNHLNVFWSSFMVEAKARGSMLLLIELPAEQGYNIQDMVERRLVPYLTAIEPERVTGFEMNERKRFKWVKFSANMTINGQETTVDRYWDESEWRVMQGSKLIDSGQHPFGECPVLAFTEGGCYPHIGGFAQIADLSRRIYNAISERDEILRSQTFSVLSYQIPPERASSFSADQVSATIGTNNMLIYEGEKPSFIAPSDGPAATYAQAIEALQEGIRRVGYEVDPPKSAKNESGIALAIRFQALNGVLSTFSQRMQDLELRMWQIVSRYMGLRDAPTVQWQADYSLADLERELATLTAMQSTGFPELAMVEQRKRIAGVAFDSLDEDRLGAVLAAIEEGTQEVPGVAPDMEDSAESDSTAQAEAPAPPEVSESVDFAPVLSQIAALSAKIDAIPVLLAPETPEPKAPDLSAITTQLTDVQAQITALSERVAAIPIEAPEPPEVKEAPEVDLTPIAEQITALAAQVTAIQNEPEEDTAQIVADAIKPVQAQITALTIANKPQPIVMLDQSGAVTRQIQINRDAAGNITGASVAPQQGN
jgi:hypothetical protein